jgi:signal transduction histidine kinase
MPRYGSAHRSDTLLPGQSPKVLASLDADAGLRRNLLVFAKLDRERRRIEAELHDGVQQDLAATAVALQLAVRALDADDPAAARQQLQELEAAVEAALERLRALTLTIYPSSLPARGLVGALAGRAEVGPLGRYPLEVEEAVYFACGELLTEATRARVWEDGGALRFEVSGAVDAAAVQHARARVAAVGGQLTVSRGGTAVAAVVPVSSVR